MARPLRTRGLRHRSSVASSALLAVALVAMLAPSASAAGVVKADYRFLKSRASSVGTAPTMTDLIGGVNPANSFVKTTVDGRAVPVLDFPNGNGLKVGTSGVVAGNKYTIVMLFRLSTNSGWNRLIEFKHGTSDQGLYLDSPHLDFYSFSGNGSTSVGANVWTQVVLTRTSGGTVTGYVDGTQQWSFADSSNAGVIDGSNELRFFQDSAAGVTGEDTAGQVARIRLYDDALTSTQVAALDRLYPKQSISLSTTSGPQGSSVTVTGKNFGPAEAVALSLTDSNAVKFSLGQGTASAGGGFTKAVTIPGGAANGAATITAKGVKSGLAAKKPFTIT